MQTKQRLDVPLSLKSVSDSGEFEGYGSVFGVKDSHDDVVMSGAFAASLRAWSDRKALPALLWQHRMDEPIGVYTEMKEDDVGLYVRGRLLIDDDPLAKRAHAHMKAGSLSPLMRKPLHLVTSNGVTPSLTVSAPAFCVTRTPINRLSVFIPPSAPAGCWSIRRPSNC